MATFDPDYHGARFYKCDLQCQTPEDGARWAAGDPIRLPNPRLEPDLQEKARQYLRRCHEVGLEVVAVTDHNFSARTVEREWFLTHLIQQNRSVAAEFNRAELVIFPGFEIDIGYHLLCLFRPGTALGQLSETLTKLGLPSPARFQNGQPQPCRHDNRMVAFDTILHEIQEQAGGLVIAAHAFSTDGIAADGRDAADYRDDRLLAVEVSDVPLRGRAQSILGGNDPAWRRQRRPAYIMSSDCKTLRPEGDRDTNYIGYRHTWIKMSQPSIEGLRQAFLDQDSRIRFGAGRPENGYTYPRLCKLSVTNAGFLADQTVAFSPNLNALIGGRGTGKSTLVEYARLVLQKEEAISGEEPKKNLDRLKQTVMPATEVRLSLEKEGTRWELARTGNGPTSVTAGDPVPDISRFFPARLLSQKEIYAIAENREARSKLIDNLIQRELDDIGRRVEDLAGQIRVLNEKVATEGELVRRKRELETERLDARTKLERLIALDEPLTQWKGYLAENEFFSAVAKDRASVSQVVRDAAKALSITCSPVDDGLKNGPNGPLIVDIASRVESAVAVLHEGIERVVAVFERELGATVDTDSVKEWKTKYAAAKAEYDSLRETLSAQGTDPDQYLEYEKTVQSIDAQIQQTQTRLNLIAEDRHKRDRRLHQLRRFWKVATRLRERTARALMDAVPKTANGGPFVKVSVEQFGDDRAFAAELQSIVQDKRRISQDDWGVFDERGRCVKPTDAFLARVFDSRTPGESPVDAFVRWVSELRSGTQPNGCPWSLTERRTQALLEWCTEARITSLRLWRPPDRIRVELYRQDGSRVGELEQGLSVGQRCTAILALLLAQDDAPAIIDQPEEDLDNEFVYRELIPLLRQIKEKRQIIVATHNANIPVNGDAELIVALEVRDGRGHIKQVRGDDCLGALDRDAVRVAVEDIMEGSEDAFRRRFEKYGF